MKEYHHDYALVKKELRDKKQEAKDTARSFVELKLQHERSAQLRSNEVDILTSSCKEAKKVVKQLEQEMAELHSKLKQQKRSQADGEKGVAQKQVKKIHEANDVLRKEIHEKSEEIEALKKVVCGMRLKH